MELDGARAGDDAGVAEQKIAAADDRQARVNARAREGCGGVAGADEVHVADDGAREGAVAKGREVHERPEGIGGAGRSCC